jgi:pimeloyl-ACP methyl ester carboxylesterase
MFRLLLTLVFASRPAPRAPETPNAPRRAILRVGECNYIPWKVALGYRQTFGDIKIFYFPNAGHYIQLEQPELMIKVIRSFLLEQPDAIPLFSSNSAPSPLPK